MKIEINIAKKHFWIITLVLVFLVFAGIAYSAVDTSAGFHDSSQIKVTDLDNNEVDLQSFVDNLETEMFPSKFCIFTHEEIDCPDGWNDLTDTAYSGRTIRGDITDIGGEGGEDTHVHYMDDSDKMEEGSHHVQDAASYTYPASSWPPYKNVRICCKQ